MIEVVFSDSEKGTAKIAKTYHRGGADGACARGSIGNSGLDTKFKQQEKISGQALGGTAKEVLGLCFSLEVGALDRGITSPQRKKLLFSKFDSARQNQLESYWQSNIDDLRILQQKAREGENIRIWYSNAPYSVCGYYFAQALLREYDCSISAVKLPEYIENQGREQGSFRSCSAWGEVGPGEWYLFLPLERKISKAERSMLAQKWVALEQQNAPLRAVVNGQVVSVSEAFYDPFIRNCMPEGTFQTANFVGNLLSLYPFGVSDWWYLTRIREMIRWGELEIVQDHPEEYRRLLKKSQENQDFAIKKTTQYGML